MTGLQSENASLRARLEEAEETLRAIREGEVDAVIVSGSQGDRIFALSETENLHRLMVETMNEAGMAITPDGLLVYCNNRACVLFGRPRTYLIGHDLSEFIMPSSKDAFHQLLSIVPSETADARIEFRVDSGKTLPMYVWANYLNRPDNPLICLVATDLSRIEADHDLITLLEEQKQQLADSRTAALNLMQDASGARAQAERASAALLVNEQRIQQALRVSRSFTFEWDPVSDDVLRSDSCAEILGLSLDDAHLDKGHNYFQRIHADDREAYVRMLHELTPKSDTYTIEYRVRRDDGSIAVLEETGKASFDATAKIRKLVGVSNDITRRKEAEDQIKESLTEKEVLLQEIHHRVKNNLQVVSSLVSLQMDNLPEPSTQALLGDVRDRVRTMALVHEKLYQSTNLGAIDFAEYAESLLTYLWRTHITRTTFIRLELDLKPATLSIQSAVPCGLILNELVGNALKHAFKNSNDGEVRVMLNICEAGRVSLRVRDNGSGLPPDMDWHEVKTLGLRLVQMLTEQLDGTVETHSTENEGTEFEIQFPLNPVE